MPLTLKLISNSYVSRGSSYGISSLIGIDALHPVLREGKIISSKNISDSLSHINFVSFSGQVNSQLFFNFNWISLYLLEYDA